MKSRIALIAALMLLTGAGVQVADAQGKHGDKHEKAPHVEKVAPPHVEKHGPVAHVAKPAPMKHAKVAPVKHVEKTVTPGHVQKTVTYQKPGAANHQMKRELAVAREEQMRRAKWEQQQNAQYRKYLEQQNRLVAQREAQIAKQNRKAQQRFLKQYYSRLAQQQRQLLVARNYSSDPYVTSPYVYQYVVSGAPRYTNQYGADALKQAVNYGYEQGYQAGQADRQDGWTADYRNSFAYADANYGYNGNYVSQSDYNYYFRQGFQRGYSDGYNTRSQYGNFTNGSGSILQNVLAAVLNLTSLR